MKTTTPEKTVMTTAVTDVRQTPLTRAAAPEMLDRLRPAEPGRGTVAAFNSAL